LSGFGFLGDGFGCFLMDFGYFLENYGFWVFDKILVFRNYFENCIFKFLKINEF